jgi:hypothetical protein
MKQDAVQAIADDAFMILCSLPVLARIIGDVLGTLAFSPFFRNMDTTSNHATHITGYNTFI